MEACTFYQDLINQLKAFETCNKRVLRLFSKKKKLRAATALCSNKDLKQMKYRSQENVLDKELVNGKLLG